MTYLLAGLLDLGSELVKVDRAADLDGLVLEGDGEGVDACAGFLGLGEHTGDGA